jgi:AraC family transcriptional regulator
MLSYRAVCSKSRSGKEPVSKLQEQQTAVSRDGISAQQSFSERYGSEGLLLSSADRGWSGISAELRNHAKDVFPWRGSPCVVELCVDVRGNETLVTRRSAGIEDRRISSRDTIRVTPPDLREGEVDIAANMADVLHIYLPLSQFSPSHFGINIDGPEINALRCDAFQYPLLAEIAHAIASELRAQTSAGSLLVESLATSMTVRLIQKHSGASAVRGRRVQ